MAGQKRNRTLVFVLGGLFIVSLSLFVFSILYENKLPKIVEEINNSSIGAILTAIITVFLLGQQSKSEELTERNSKVFEKKLEIYEDFLKNLQDTIANNSIDVDLDASPGKDEIKDLLFQLAKLQTHTNSENILKILKNVRDVFRLISTQESNSRGVSYEQLYDSLGAIVSVFQIELYGEAMNVNDRIKGEIKELISGKEGILPQAKVAAQAESRKRAESIISVLFKQKKIKTGDTVVFWPGVDHDLESTDKRITAKIVKNQQKCLQVDGDQTLYSFSALRSKIIKDNNFDDMDPNWGFAIRTDFGLPDGRRLQDLLKE